MKYNPFAQHYQYLPLIIATLFGLTLVVLRGYNGLEDPFHQGEFFAYAISLYQKNTDPTLSIHGFVDAAPALLTGALLGFDRHFIITNTFYEVLSLISALLLILCGHKLYRAEQGRIWFLTGLSLAAGQLVDYRDLFLLISILFFVRLTHQKQHNNSSIGQQALFGIIIALSLHWSYDRGLSGSIAFGTATLYLSTKNRAYFISIGVFIVSLLAMWLISDAFSITNYAKSILSLAESSPQWQNPWSKRNISLAVIVLSLVFITLYAAFKVCIKSKTTDISIFIALALLSLMMARIAINRVDYQHAAMGMWAPLLLVAFFSSYETWRSRSLLLLYTAAAVLAIKTANFSTGIPLTSALYLLPFSQFLLRANPRSYKTQVPILVIVLLFLIWNIVRYGIKRDHYEWLKQPFSTELNHQTSPATSLWAANELIRANAHCVFDLTNNGLINGLTQLPSCTWFTYPIYAPKNAEPEIINQLKLAAPSAIVYSNELWSYAIDNKPMNERLPMLDQYIISNYPSEHCEHKHCIRYLESNH